jgi:hypothetical protein
VKVCVAPGRQGVDAEGEAGRHRRGD